MTTVMGQRLLRREDPPLMTGEARFVDDLVVPGALWMALVRSPHAHARITSIATDAAAALPGVVHVFTGEDLRADWAGAMPCAWPVTADMKNPDHWPVAVGKVVFVGEAVAVVLARTRAEAYDAADAVAVEYEPLDAVVALADAAADTVVIHDGLGTNRSYVWELTPDADAVAAAFDAAVHVVRERYVQQRLVPMAMEPR